MLLPGMAENRRSKTAELLCFYNEIKTRNTTHQQIMLNLAFCGCIVLRFFSPTQFCCSKSKMNTRNSDHHLEHPVYTDR